MKAGHFDPAGSWTSRADLSERKKRFPSWDGAEKFEADLNFGEKNGLLVATCPGP